MISHGQMLLWATFIVVHHIFFTIRIIGICLPNFFSQPLIVRTIANRHQKQFSVMAPLPPSGMWFRPFPTHDIQTLPYREEPH